MWTTHKELAWLSDRLPEYQKVQASPSQQITGWLRKLALGFVTTFPSHRTQGTEAVVKVGSC